MAKIDERTIDHKALEHMRILAVRRVIEDGEAPSDVIKSFGLARTLIFAGWSDMRRPGGRDWSRRSRKARSQSWTKSSDSK